ncbi:DUF1311 domain-containing protein [Kamptonema cortianum]|uniref:DUF1311 domain-containing protein n=1 Tax=Geitlerinema calcuttense NRMC-F 0142 TaxID=2922238 RepID=A0ABT7M0Q2_9CYAN|nr:MULTISPECIES: lysozyme inhibitor LprI family protein [Cyanophyceae]MDK3161906.1 DUF1311 domain-containing protein [Kamptonema cortianum]MDL5050580.1 DUF1311 domain-containing protein [Oscillatoria amoena NRMC-F 0135]MDL5055596.1 DUF1311 domain-containing protein [Oscillatoria laete-virens NRMC-F 0139]MDL5057838.1 DUF1311 domain-containing protein [Geitlerinema calcuttense NRMC-F 0142]
MRLFLLTVFLCGLTCPVFSPLRAQSQMELNQTAADSLAAAEKEMGDTLQKIVTIYSDEKLFLEKLVGSQKAWETYCKSQMDALFPLEKGRDPSQEYGSSYPMAHDLEKEKLVRERIARLKVWLDGVEEGDIGAGSVYSKDMIRELQSGGAK